MKYNYPIYFLAILIIIFRSSFINFINNFSSLLFAKNNNIEIKVLKDRVSTLEKEYNELINFKNNINIKENYIITNFYLNNYSYDTLLINGNNYHIGDEVINENGLIGIISKIYSSYSEITPIYKTNLPVIINDFKGKITGYNDDNNLIIREVSNYNNININDKVFTINGSYIGKVININKEDLDTTLIVKPINYKDSKYVAVIMRQT